MIEVPVPMQRDPLRPLRYVLRVPLLLLHIVLGLPPTLLLINCFTALTLREWSITGSSGLVRGLMHLFASACPPASRCVVPICCRQPCLVDRHRTGAASACRLVAN